MNRKESKCEWIVEIFRGVSSLGFCLFLVRAFQALVRHVNVKLVNLSHTDAARASHSSICTYNRQMFWRTYVYSQPELSGIIHSMNLLRRTVPTSILVLLMRYATCHCECGCNPVTLKIARD